MLNVFKPFPLPCFCACAVMALLLAPVVERSEAGPTTSSDSSTTAEKAIELKCSEIGSVFKSVAHWRDGVCSTRHDYQKVSCCRHSALCTINFFWLVKS